MDKKEWRGVVGYENLYVVSNFGEIKSLDRKKWNGKGFQSIKGKILKQRNDTRGYPFVNLSKNGKIKSTRVHRVVAKAFLSAKEGRNGLRREVVDHIDNNKENNLLSNLQIISQRENNTKDRSRRNLPNGVRFKNKKYYSSIKHNLINYHLGVFSTKEEAYRQYLSAIEYTNNNKTLDRRKLLYPFSKK